MKRTLPSEGGVARADRRERQKGLVLTQRLVLVPPVIHVLHGHEQRHQLAHIAARLSSTKSGIKGVSLWSVVHHTSRMGFVGDGLAAACKGHVYATPPAESEVVQS